MIINAFINILNDNQQDLELKKKIIEHLTYLASQEMSYYWYGCGYGYNNYGYSPMSYSDQYIEQYQRRAQEAQEYQTQDQQDQTQDQQEQTQEQKQSKTFIFDESSNFNTETSTSIDISHLKPGYTDLILNNNAMDKKTYICGIYDESNKKQSQEQTQETKILNLKDNLYYGSFYVYLLEVNDFQTNIDMDAKDLLIESINEWYNKEIISDDLSEYYQYIDNSICESFTNAFKNALTNSMNKSHCKIGTKEFKRNLDRQMKYELNFRLEFLKTIKKWKLKENKEKLDNELVNYLRLHQHKSIIKNISNFQRIKEIQKLDNEYYNFLKEGQEKYELLTFKDSLHKLIHDFSDHKFKYDYEFDIDKVIGLETSETDYNLENWDTESNNRDKDQNQKDPDTDNELDLDLDLDTNIKEYNKSEDNYWNGWNMWRS